MDNTKELETNSKWEKNETDEQNSKDLIMTGPIQKNWCQI